MEHCEGCGAAMDYEDDNSSCMCGDSWYDHSVCHGFCLREGCDCQVYEDWDGIHIRPIEWENIYSREVK